MLKIFERFSQWFNSKWQEHNNVLPRTSPHTTPSSPPDPGSNSVEDEKPWGHIYGSYPYDKQKRFYGFKDRNINNREIPVNVFSCEGAWDAANFLNSDACSALFRSFGQMRARILLQKQAELSQIEWEIIKLNQADKKICDGFVDEYVEKGKAFMLASLNGDSSRASEIVEEMKHILEDKINVNHDELARLSFWELETGATSNEPNDGSITHFLTSSTRFKIDHYINSLATNNQKSRQILLKEFEEKLKEYGALGFDYVHQIRDL